MPRIGLHIKQLRNRRKLTVRELASRSGVSHATISLIERDRTSPSLDTLSAMLDALGTTLVGFFEDVPQSVPYSPFYNSDELIEIGDAAAVSYRMLGMNHPNRHIHVAATGTTSTASCRTASATSARRPPRSSAP